jgi:hypothetical protein
VNEGARDGDHVRVRLPLTDRMALTDTHTRTGPAGTPSSCVASGNAMVPLPATVTLAVPLARKASYLLSLPSSASSHLIHHYAVSLRKCRPWVSREQLHAVFA